MITFSLCFFIASHSNLKLKLRIKLDFNKVELKQAISIFAKTTFTYEVSLLELYNLF